MATVTGLIRSYYGWLTKTEKALEESSEEIPLGLIPAQRPTALSSVVKTSLRVVRALRGTAFEERAMYWADLFKGIDRDGWRGEVRPVDACREKIHNELKRALGDVAV